MHSEVAVFVKEVRSTHPTFFKKRKVLEVGSLDLNGSVRKYFKRCDYVGLDLAEGRGVDVVMPIHEYNPSQPLDVVISTEMLEHDVHWQESLKKMYSILKSHGLLLLTCASTNRPEHGTRRSDPNASPFTTDYYRNISIQDFSSVLKPEMFNPYFIESRTNDNDLVFYGIKN